MVDRRLQVFHAVAKHLSFTKAAALFKTQPAVTFQIRQLEEHFNTWLFDRAHGRIALTSAGAVALEYAEHHPALAGRDRRLDLSRHDGMNLTSLTQLGGAITMKPVAFTRVRPGETLLSDAA